MHTDSLKIRTLTGELLAAICALSVTQGHRMVLAALSDYRVAFDESFRFETILSYIRFTGEDEGDHITGAPPRDGIADDGGWEARTAVLTLINALTNCPDSLEDRIQLREEFSRRGLNEIIVVSIRIRILFLF